MQTIMRRNNSNIATHSQQKFITEHEYTSTVEVPAQQEVISPPQVIMKSKKLLDLEYELKTLKREAELRERDALLIMTLKAEINRLRKSAKAPAYRRLFGI